METLLGDGLVLRGARPDDVKGAADLLARQGDQSDALDLELVVRDEGLDGTAVVVDVDRVVSTLTLLDEVVQIDGLSVPAGQIELVATDPEYEGRGLVRALMDWGHARSRRRHLIQIMIGIPYFYRQFGYEYAVPMAPWRPLAVVPPPPEGMLVRRATPDDIPAMQSLQDRTQATVDISMGHTTACWRWLVEREASEQWVAERAGRLIGVCRAVASGEETVVTELAADDDDGRDALLAHVAASSDQQVVVQQRPGSGSGLADLLGSPAGKPDWYYARVEHLAPLLAHLGPVLAGRLDTAGLGGRDHEMLLSSWRSHVRFTIGPSRLCLVAEGRAEQAPISKGGSGVPPDALASLLLGPYGAIGLEERLPDCHLGRQRDLMAALFPPRTADLLTFYVPY